MSFVMTYYFVTLAVILMIHEAIYPVRGQCTVQGCDNGDPLISIVAEIQQLRVELFDKLNKQVQSIHELLNASFQGTKSQHDVIFTSLQAIDRRIEEHDISIKNQTKNSREFANGSCGPSSEVCDCADIKARGNSPSGVTEVCVGRQPNRICSFAFCYMETDNRVSLVFQRRKDGSVNFNRTWAEYREGFGNPDGEFWLGNEMLHLLTSKRNYKLRVDLEDWEGEKRFAEYSTFSISSSADNYTLTIGNYSGNAGDSLYIYYNKRCQFSTNDADNDDYGSKHCARQYGGGWWYTNCAFANLNGLYHYQKGRRFLRMVTWLFLWFDLPQCCIEVLLWWVRLSGISYLLVTY